MSLIKYQIPQDLLQKIRKREVTSLAMNIYSCDPRENDHVVFTDVNERKNEISVHVVRRITAVEPLNKFNPNSFAYKVNFE